MAFQEPVLEGVFYANYGEKEFNYMRFYADGFVMSATVMVKQGDAIATWELVQKWFHREHHPDPYPVHGQWSLDGKQIRFTSVSENGAVDYSGSFLGDRMVLDSYSHINGHSATGTVYHRLTNS